MSENNPQVPHPYEDVVLADQPGQQPDLLDANGNLGTAKRVSRRRALILGAAGAGVLAVGGAGGWTYRQNTQTHHLTARVTDWQTGGTYETVNGHRIFVRRTGGNGPLVVLLHGFPTNSYDWREVIPTLEATGAAVLAFDFLGFGLSDKPTGIRYSLKMQADIVEQLVGRRPALIVAHDMGDSVAAELMARDLDGDLTFAMNGVLFTNSSVIIGKANLTAVQKLLRGPLGPLVAKLNSETLFKKQLAGIFSTGHPFTTQEADDQWSLSTYNDGHKILDKLSYFNHERVDQADRWEGAIRDWRGRLDVGWGGVDHISGEPVLQALIALRPSAAVTRWPDLGHYPQIEDPTSVGRLAAQFVSVS